MEGKEKKGRITLITLCKKVEPNKLTPINCSNSFLVIDPQVFAVINLDNIIKPVEVNIKWIFNENVLSNQVLHCIPDKNTSQHKLASYINMSIVEHKGLFGKWLVEVYVNETLIETKNFVIHKPISTTGKVRNTNNVFDIKV